MVLPTDGSLLGYCRVDVGEPARACRSLRERVDRECSSLSMDSSGIGRSNASMISSGVMVFGGGSRDADASG
eukprot:1193013-Amphidinium_carterae.1